MNESIVTELLALRKKRLKLQREVDLLEQEEKGMAQILINEMEKHRIDTVVTDLGEIERKSSIEPLVTNWPALLDHIIATNSVDLFQKRLMVSAAKARLAAKEDLPGVTWEEKQTLKFNV